LNVPLVSVIIVNYNGVNLLEDCLGSLRGQAFRDFEVILVDNASSDGSLAFVRENYPEVKILQNRENLGYGGGNNVGIVMSKGKYLCLLNNDTKADPNWLQRLVEASSAGDKKVGMYASKILDYDHPEVIDNTGLVMYRDGIARGRGRLEKDSGQFRSNEEVFFPSGCAGFYKKEMLDEIGLFDEDFYLYLDDVDIGLRARMNGWKCIYVPDAVVYHKYSATTDPYSPLKAYLVERNRIWVVIKYFPLGMAMVSPLYSLVRYLLQAYGIVIGKGASSRLVKSGSVLQTAGILCKAYVSALGGFGKMVNKRRETAKLKRVSHREISEWFKKFGIGAREVAFKD
jgi:GT2 family glycosyltransferase